MGKASMDAPQGFHRRAVFIYFSSRAINVDITYLLYNINIFTTNDLVRGGNLDGRSSSMSRADRPNSLATLGMKTENGSRYL
jgi:hypothetical protein